MHPQSKVHHKIVSGWLERLAELPRRLADAVPVPLLPGIAEGILPSPSPAFAGTGSFGDDGLFNTGGPRSRTRTEAIVSGIFEYKEYRLGARPVGELHALHIGDGVSERRALGFRHAAFEALREGAYDYMIKPFKRDQAVSVVRRALEKFSLIRENFYLREALEGKHNLGKIIGKSESMRRVFQMIERVAPTPLGRFLAWLLPSAPTPWWRPATAFALPLLLGVAMGLSDTRNAAAASTVIDWELQEQDLLLAVSEEPWYE